MNIAKHPKRLLFAGAITGSLVGGIAAGATILGPTIASAATNPSPAPATPGAGPPNMPTHGSAAHESAETAVTGTNAAKAQAAAVKFVGGGTAGAVTTDFTKHGYEVTVTKADGTKVEVHLDSSFNVMERPGGPGGPGRPNDNDADDSGSGSAG